MKISPNRLDRSFYSHQKEFEDAALRALRSGWYILGNEVTQFEEEFADYTEAKYCVGLASGLDALWIAVKALGIGKGDEVIVQGNTYIASVMGITINGATPVFVEPDEYFNIDTTQIEKKITKHTKAILVVHLYGQSAKMDSLVQICKKYHLKLIEDCAQSHGAEYNGKKTGTYGDIGCFSFYPSKNIGAFGDAGAIVTDSKELADEIRIFRNYGSQKRYYNKVVGANSRLDELQAALLRVRLKYAEETYVERTSLCKTYSRYLDNEFITLPQVCKNSTSVWHQYVIKTDRRSDLIEYLNKKDIGSIIHYPIPPHLSEAYHYLGLKEGDLPVTELYARQVLSLPLYNGMTAEEQEYVIQAINEFK